MNTDVHKRRQNSLREAMATQGIDCFLVGVSSTLRYLTGYSRKADERLLILVLTPKSDPFIVVNQMSVSQFPDSGIQDMVPWADGDRPIPLLLAELGKRSIPTQKIAIEKSLTGHFLLPLMHALPHAKFSIGNALTDKLRLYKDETERELMATACRLANDAYAACMERGSAWIGKTENEFMAMLAFEMSTRGLAMPSGIVAAGEHAAVPHHVNSDTPIRESTCLLVDFGANYKGYHTDMTRTVHFGEPSEKFRTVYEIVLEALYKGHAAAKIGNQLQDVDNACRSHIADKGYGVQFIHRTGHGIGLDGHEGPSAAAGETTPIVPGMTFSIEPGIYLPGEFGVRIEDQAMITEDGLHILHSFPRELTIISV